MTPWPRSGWRAGLRTALLWAGVALALLGTLSLYQRPEFLLKLADQLWSCF